MAVSESFTTLIHGDLVTPGGVRQDTPLTWDANGRLVAVGEEASGNAEVIDVSGCLVVPGFINLHVHGGSGVDFLDGTVDALERLAIDQASQGVTAFLPTTASAPQEKLLHAGRTLNDYTDDAGKGARIAGWYVEGPYLNPVKCGAQNPVYLRDPSWEEYRAWQDASGNRVRVVAMAPECDPQGDFIRRLTEDGVITAAAHTDADYPTALNAIAAGLSQATHTFNAMSHFDYRSPRILEALLETERVMLEIIPDCTEIPHIHPVAIRLLERTAGSKRLCAVTDAISASGMPDGEYALGDMAVIKDGEMAYLKDAWEREGAKQLAGSVLQMNWAFGNLVDKVGFSIVQASQVCSLNPARVLRVEDEYGTLERGKTADVTVLDAQSFEVRYTFRDGVRIDQDTDLSQ